MASNLASISAVPRHPSEDNDTSGDFLAGEGPREELGLELPDWERERCAALSWQPSKQLMQAVREYQRARAMGGVAGAMAAKAAVLKHRFWSVVTGAEVPLNANIDGGLLLPHPNGVVIHPDAEIGPNCMLFQQVTIGTGPRPGLPRLGCHVDVGPGAKVLGGITIGDYAVIGANAVVLDDVPPFAVAVGIPARSHPMRRAAREARSPVT